jgi:hypothetical protein
MTRLPVDLDDLVEALTWNDYMMEMYRYLDRETGKVITILQDDDLEDDDGEEGDGDESRKQARLVEEHPERFIEIEPIESHEAFRIMEDFVDEVKVEVVRRRLIRALTGRRKPFRAFKNALEEFPEARQQWFDFEAERHLAMAREWLAGEGIETTWQSPKRKKN